MVAVGEAASNAIEHAYRGTSPGRVTVELTYDGDRVTATITDRGSWQPAARALSAPGSRPIASARGRGLEVIRHLVSQIQITQGDPSGTNPGTVVTLVDLDPLT